MLGSVGNGTAPANGGFPPIADIRLSHTMRRVRGLGVKVIGLLVAVSAVVFSTRGVAVPRGGITLGVLEDLPGHYAGESHFRAVRVVFQQKGREWRPYPSDCRDQQCLRTISANYPKFVRWAVGLSGRMLGTVTGRTPKDFEYYSDVGLQRLASSGSTPSVGKRSMEYAGNFGEPVLRPLIVSSESYFADPDSWTRLPLPTGTARALRQQFRHKFPTVSTCKSPDENKLISWRYADADIRVSQSYVARTGWALAELKLTGYNCDSPLDDPFVGHWFAISPKGQVRFLEAGLNFLDAGDYDHSGRSAVIFSIDRDNRGGYEMFYDDFRKRAVFQFLYH